MARLAKLKHISLMKTIPVSPFQDSADVNSSLAKKEDEWYSEK